MNKNQKKIKKLYNSLLFSDVTPARIEVVTGEIAELEAKEKERLEKAKKVSVHLVNKKRRADLEKARIRFFSTPENAPVAPDSDDRTKALKTARNKRKAARAEPLVYKLPTLTKSAYRATAARLDVYFTVRDANKELGRVKQKTPWQTRPVMKDIKYHQGKEWKLNFRGKVAQAAFEAKQKMIAQENEKVD